jgi:biotin synthase
MPNFTPLKYRSHYQIYPKKFSDSDDVAPPYLAVLEMIRSLGRTPGTGKGHSRKASGTASVD